MPIQKNHEKTRTVFDCLPNSTVANSQHLLPKLTTLSLHHGLKNTTSTHHKNPKIDHQPHNRSVNNP